MRSSRARRTLLAAVVAAAALSPASLARPTTTAPSANVVVLVLINDRKIAVFRYQEVLTPDSELVPLRSYQPVPRGDHLTFNIFNRGKKPHDFVIFGKATPLIRPGHKAHLSVTATVRGNFRYGSRSDKGKAFSGFLTIG
jgi:hypothetical protein